MNDQNENPTRIHLSELDEYFASKVLEQDSPLKFLISKEDSQGNLNITQKVNELKIDDVGIDFELSPSEYQSLDSVDIQDFTSQTVYTSSAFEFFDFLLIHFSKVEFVFDFNGISWRIKILKTS